MKKGLMTEDMTQEFVKYLFTCVDGELYWNVGDIRYRNKKAGYYSPRGYGKIKIQGRAFGTHKLIFLYHYGYIPTLIDHIDRNPSNNRIENLRECNISENNRNSKLNKNNKSGIKGVYWNTNEKKWVARCYVYNKQYHLGYFKNKLDAEKAVKEFRILHHGSFYSHG